MVMTEEQAYDLYCVMGGLIAGISADYYVFELVPKIIDLTASVTLAIADSATDVLEPRAPIPPTP